MNYTADIAIVGGGASGLVAAITAKRLNPNLSVYIFEALDRVGKKLITTGNGRCNITNLKLDLNRFHGQDVAFCQHALSRFGYEEIKNFFYSIGVDFIAEGDKVFPSSLQASSVVDALRFECERIGVNTVLNCKIEDIAFGKEYVLHSCNDTVYAKKLILATGLLSGGDKIGSFGNIFRFLKSSGFKTVKVSPSIVQLKTETDFVRQLKGIKVDAKATLFCGNKAVCEYTDEVLFCDYGLSGPAILQISRQSGRDDKEYFVSLDLYPETNIEELILKIKDRAKLLSIRTLEDFFVGSLNKRLGQVVLKYCGYKLSDSVMALNDDDLAKIANTLKNFKFKVLSNTGFLNSQVSAGGIATLEFSNTTLMSKRYKGLFVVGELLDIDGDCGGFNLSWAFASGMLAAESVVKQL
ncbi:MAG: aminoacetone oxidase family FAD-binding enzyme [Clostridia bacterium]|nr:aminoacetone oxidase family FAD-binding enzyme [Clostridia bacterium]